MNTFEFEIAIQSKSGDNSWPIVIRCKQPDGLTIHAKGILRLTQDDFEKLIEESENEKAYGTLLGKALFREEVRDTFIRAFSKSSQDNRLRILLAIEASQKDQVKTLHWERLCAPIDADGGWNLLARDRRVPFSLYIPTIIDRCFSPIGRRDLRALILVASPSNLETYKLASFDVETALSGVKEALGEIPYNFLANNVEGALGPPTLQELSKQLTNAPKPYTLLHFVCHGKLIDTGETVLYWATPDDQVLPITAKELLEELRHVGNQKNLPHFTFLCTCESAIPRAEEALGGLAQRLVRDLGMPAVVAMTRKVSVKTALAIGQSFYRRLRESGEVDVALQEATAGLGDRYDITVPALFSRLGGRPLFSDRLEDRELTDEEIGYGIGKLQKLIAERAPHASVLKQRFKTHAEKLNNVRGADSQAARNERRQALDELDNICDQVLDLSFDALAALGKEPPEYKAECPFPGLYSFGDKKYHKFFFGRDELIKELQEELEKDNFLAVIGPSGSGKSSVVLAGLIPKLKEQNPSLQWAYLTPGREPVKQLERRLERLSKVSEQQSVLLVDQFEELFTLCEDKDNRQEFITSLLTFASRRKVVMTMRADFLGECTFYPELSKRIEARPKLVGTMKPAELITVMKMQADKAGLRFETGLSNSILNEVQEEPGAMPLLQYALQELWKRRHGRWLCDEEYQAIGRVQQAIAKTADDFYNSLPASEQELVRNIFFRLTRLDESAVQGEKRRDTRRRVELEDLVPEGGDLAVTKKLVQQLAGEGARLVVTSRNDATGNEEVEVAHEALIRYWSMLQNWLDQNRSNLQLRETISQAAEHWEKHKNQPDKDTYLIHQGGRLQDAEDLLKQPKFVYLNPQETEYLKACVELRDRQRNLQRLATTGVIVVAVIMTGLVVWLGYAFQQTKRQQVEQYAAAAKALLATNPTEGLVNAISAVGLAKSFFVRFPNYSMPASAQNSLFTAVQISREQNSFETNTELVRAVAFSTDGQTIVIVGGDGTSSTSKVQLLNSKGQDLKKTCEVAGFVTSVAISGDGQIIVIAGQNRKVGLWNRHNQCFKEEFSTPIIPHSSFASIRHKVATLSQVRPVAISSDGTMIVSGEDDGKVGIWTRQGISLVLPFKAHDSTITSIVISSDGKTIVTAGNDGKVGLWNRLGKPLVTPFKVCDEGIQCYINSVAISPDGQTIVTAGNDVKSGGKGFDGSVRLWDRQGKRLVADFSVPADHSVTSVAISPDGQTIVTGGGDGKVGLWHYNARSHEVSPLSEPFKGHGLYIGSVFGKYDTNVHSVSISPDGHTIVTGGSDSTVKLWSVQAQPLPDSFKIPLPQGYHESFITNSLKTAITPDGHILVTDYEGNLQLWKRPGRNPRAPISSFTQNESLYKLAISSDGQTIFGLNTKENKVQEWNRQGKAADSPFSMKKGISYVAISPNGQTIASLDDKQVQVWNRQGQRIGVAPLPKSKISSVAISPDGQTIVAGGEHGQVMLWNRPWWHPRIPFLAYKGNTIVSPSISRSTTPPVRSVDISADNQSIISLNGDEIYLWNREGQPLSPPFSHEKGINSAVISADGHTIVIGGSDGTVKSWDIRLDTWLKVACERLRYHPVLATPKTEVAKEAKATCKQYAWNLKR
ncbi:CHAT domain-containing protein [Geitlerinema sp. PCC 7407]|uniref:nSTAND1 domain-containing NTPase n=1 Tax=Geitlerinema sp. PCC 7407 TaxID=1173025 RepID=UPI00029FF925|nr:CHAT domain-containing protein [Geitlerinema sp. PCC 7407]AFY66272.1 WD40 repeat, subgroup [Geitlerinema sp. PCC 7407]